MESQVLFLFLPLTSYIFLRHILSKLQLSTSAEQKDLLDDYDTNANYGYQEMGKMKIQNVRTRLLLEPVFGLETGLIPFGKTVTAPTQP